MHPVRRCNSYGMSTKTRKSISINIPDYITSHSSIKKPLFIHFSVRLLLPTHCRCRGHFCNDKHTHTHTHTHTHIFGRTLLDKGLALRKDLYLASRNTQQQTDIHAPGGIPTSKPRKRAAVNLSLKTAQPPGSAQQSSVITW